MDECIEFNNLIQYKPTHIVSQWNNEGAISATKSGCRLKNATGNKRFSFDIL